MTIQKHEVRYVLRSVNPRKATGPDSVSRKLLRACSDQLAGVFTRIFNLSLLSATIMPLPKTAATDSMNDYRPVPLAPIVKKCFERMVLQHINTSLPPTFDSHQFAYSSTEDAITIALHTVLRHLEHRESYVIMLLIDCSLAFRTIIPDILVSKLSNLGLPSQITDNH